MLLDVERPGVERELPPPPLEEDPVGDRRRHEVTEGDDCDLGGDGGDGQRLFPVPEELVQKREQDAGGRAEDPHAEGQDGD